MRKLTPALYGALSAIALSATGVAIAQTPAPAAPEASAQTPGKNGRHMGPTTRAEAEARADRMFARFDANSDGQLNAEDRQARVAQRFARLDGNSDGALSLEEFTAGRDKRGEGMRGKRGDRRHHMSHRGHRGHGMMGGADADGNGQVSAAEFKAAALTRFDAADIDRNGTVTAEERKASRQKMHEARKQARAERRAEQQGAAD